MSTISVLNNYIDDIADTDSVSYTTADKYVALSRWAHTITEEAIDAQDEWDFQEEWATSDLVANQREYVFPTDILKIKKIELKLDGTNWEIATIIDKSEIDTPIASETDITNNFSNNEPYVALLDKSLYILSGTITDVTAGIKIWYSEEIVGVDADGDDIASFSADTDKPNLAEFAQMGLVCGAVLDFAEKYGIENKVARMNIRLYGHSIGRPADSASVGGLIGRVRSFYGSRVQDRRILMKGASSLENYE